MRDKTCTDAVNVPYTVLENSGPCSGMNLNTVLPKE